MAERSAGALHWLWLALVLWVLVRFFPATGRHRKPSAPNRTAVTCGNTNDHVRLVATPNPAWNRSRVRPYWTAKERALRWKRRRVLVMAADFRLDLDTRNIHAVTVGGGAQ